MVPDRTELEWTYTPADFFEAPYQCTESEYQIVIENGRAVVTLQVPRHPVEQALEDRIRASLTAIFLVRQMQMQRTFDLGGPRICQHAEGRKDIAITPKTGHCEVLGNRLDFRLGGAAGEVIRDTKAERIAGHTALLNEIAPKLAQSPTLRELLASYSDAVSDPSNELVHLYEVRDALAKHYGGESAARSALNISTAEWKRLGVLANVEPLEEGRHRGKHIVGRRGASPAELEEARGMVQRWIIAFARSV